MFFSYVKDKITIDESKIKAYNKILIIGAGYTGHAISSQLQQNPKTNIKIVGFLDDDIGKIGRKIQCNLHEIFPGIKT